MARRMPKNAKRRDGTDGWSSKPLPLEFTVQLGSPTTCPCGCIVTVGPNAAVCDCWCHDVYRFAWSRDVSALAPTLPQEGLE